MKKTMIYLPNDIHEGLRRLAFEQRSSIAELIRQAVELVYGEDLVEARPANQALATPAPANGKAKAAIPAPQRKRVTAPPLRRAVTAAPSAPNTAVAAELYLRRLPVDEALYRLDAYLDDAFMSGHRWVRIVHGKGTGTLRRAVWDHLHGHSLVQSYRIADPGEGDAGVTVALLAER